tara:strand:+ start:353 stop:619 length:267 start_codon:yes stop_codon:yes gene_type:complete
MIDEKNNINFVEAFKKIFGKNDGLDEEIENLNPLNQISTDVNFLGSHVSNFNYEKEKMKLKSTLDRVEDDSIKQAKVEKELNTINKGE